jgi:hypothetical protein
MNEGHASAVRIGRVIKAREHQTADIEIRHLDERDSAFALFNDFGMTDFAPTQWDELDLMEVKPSRIDRTKRSWRK